MANSEDRDQTAPEEAVWSESALFVREFWCTKFYDIYRKWQIDDTFLIFPGK